MAFDPEIKASKERAKNGYGQNGYPGASSLMPGQTKPNIPNVSVSTPTVASANAKDDDARLAAISGTPIKAHDAMRHRGLDDTGSPSGKVPAANVRRSKTDGVGRPIK